MIGEYTANAGFVIKYCMDYNIYVGKWRAQIYKTKCIVTIFGPTNTSKLKAYRRIEKQGWFCFWQK